MITDKEIKNLSEVVSEDIKDRQEEARELAAEVCEFMMEKYKGKHDDAPEGAVRSDDLALLSFAAFMVNKFFVNVAAETLREVTMKAREDGDAV